VSYICCQDADVIRAFCERYDIGRTKVYLEIGAGRLSIKKLGRRTLIPIEAAKRWFESLPDGGRRAPANDNEQPRDVQRIAA
jgi:hypothetical protein